MFSAADLQGSKASLKKRPAKQTAPSTRSDAVQSSKVPSAATIRTADHQSGKQPPTISLKALHAARTGLHRTPREVANKKPVASSDFKPQEDSALPAFAKRKDLFERRKVSSSIPLETGAVVCVGIGNESEDFTVELKTLRSAPFFRDQLRGVVEFQLPSHKPAVFRLFLEYCLKPREPITYRPRNYSEEPWASNAAESWFLAVELRARRFEKYALSQFIQNCAAMLKPPWKTIQDHSVPDSSLFRFSRHWIAWNTALSNAGTHEYVGLEAADLVNRVTKDTRDPRIYDLDHWYQSCGDDLNALCEHNPIYQRQQRLKKDSQSKSEPAIWGLEEELKAQHRY